MNRRSFIHLALGGTLASAVLGSACQPPPIRSRAQLFGFNLIAWDRRALTNATAWRKSIAALHGLGISRVTIVPYQLLDPDSLRLLSKSQFDLVFGPSAEVVAEIIRYAKTLNMSVSLKPMIEIDNEEGEGDIWRGTVKIGPDKAGAFFDSYQAHILQMLKVAVDEGADRFYIGSELAGLVTDKRHTGRWLDLIVACRRSLGDSSCLLTYAANFDEYEQVPFWSELDEIGVDAYFPLARKKEAAGLLQPGHELLRKRFDKVLIDLQAFSKRMKRPMFLAEWGVVPFDLTTTEPSAAQPSESYDLGEMLNAYTAVIGAVQAQGDWLAGCDFWHWSVSSHNDSNYSIDAGSPVAEMLRSAAML